MAASALLIAAGSFAQTKVTANLDLGDFANPTQQITAAQNIEQAPFNFYYEGSGSQFIYSAEEIAPIVDKQGEIVSISFCYGDPDFSSYMDFGCDLKCYVQLIDDAQFTYIDNKSHWFKPIDVSTTAEAAYEFSFDKAADIDVITLTFPTPFKITAADAGKNLLVTCTQSYTSGDSDNGQYWRPYVYNNAERNYRMACFGIEPVSANNFLERVAAGGQISFTEDHSDCFRTDLPVARIAYSYEDFPDGIADIDASAEAPARMFDLRGCEVSAENAAPGIYIVRQGDKSYKKVVR